MLHMQYILIYYQNSHYVQNLAKKLITARFFIEQYIKNAPT